MYKIILGSLCASILLLSACSGNEASNDISTDLPEASSTSTDGKMTPAILAELITNFDKDAKADGSRIEFSVRERDFMLFYDERADRMRIISPIAPASIADGDILARMLQANFDAVLDSRYALANNVIWAVFVHSLSSLTEENFISGIAQTYTAAETFGSSYTSGAVVFGGGDSNSIHEDLLKELEKAKALKNGRGI